MSLWGWCQSGGSQDGMSDRPVRPSHVLAGACQGT